MRINLNLINVDEHPESLKNILVTPFPPLNSSVERVQEYYLLE